MKTLFFETIDSTNTYLKKHYEEHEDMTFVAAGLQTAGRGRSERNWKASAGKNLTFSLLIKDEEVMKEYKALSVLAACSVLSVLKEYGIDDLMIKWPNDVYAGEKKICGILLEGVSKEKMECLIIGIGINVNEESFEGDYLHMPTSMRLELNEEIDLNIFREKIYERLSENIEQLKKGTDFYPEISAYDYLKGKTASCEIKGQNRQIEVIGINEDYSLKVICEKEVMDLSSSEVTFHIEKGNL